MNSDFEELLSIFNESGVRYFILGGHAVMLYTEPRYTKDLDVWIDSSAENAERVYRSLLRFGAPLAGLIAKDFAEEGSFYQVGIPPVRVDILMSMDGVGASASGTLAMARPSGITERSPSIILR